MKRQAYVVPLYLCLLALLCIFVAIWGLVNDGYSTKTNAAARARDHEMAEKPIYVIKGTCDGKKVYFEVFDPDRKQ